MESDFVHKYVYVLQRVCSATALNGILHKFLNLVQPDICTGEPEFAGGFTCTFVQDRNRLRVQFTVQSKVRGPKEWWCNGLAVLLD
jgi:hypothetical protein